MNLQYQKKDTHEASFLNDVEEIIMKKVFGISDSES